MKQFLLPIILICANSFIFSQISTLWTKTFGGSNIDVGYYVSQTSDGGYIITGYTRSYGTMSGRNVWLIKTDANGNEIWNNAYGGNADDEAYSVQQTADGGYIIIGYTKSFGAGAMDVYLLRTDSAGTLLWSKFFGGSNDEEGYSVLQTNDGGFLVAGATSSSGAGGRDVYLVRTDASGNTLWTKTLGGLSSDGAREIVKSFDGNYILTGWTFSSGPGSLGNCLLMKVDASGNQIWSKAFGGTDVDRGHSVKPTADGGFIITGYTDSFGAGLYDLLLIKTDSLGNETWKKFFGGTGRDYGHSIDITTDGGYAITGYTLSYGAGGDDVWLIKTNSEGVEEWKTTFGGTASDVGYWLDVTAEGDFVIVGHTLSSGAGVHDVWLIKVAGFVPVELVSFNAVVNNRQVILNWQTASEKNNHGFNVERTEDKSNWNTIAFVKGNGTTTETNNYSFSDKAIDGSGTIYYRLKQVDLDGSYSYSKVISAKNDITPTEFVLYQNYPNPFNPSTVISYQLSASSYVELKIFDVLGNEVAMLIDNEWRETGYHNYQLLIINYQLPSGIYFYSLTAGEFTATKKFVFLK